MTERRHRIHELVLALIAQQQDLELLDGDETMASRDPAGWLERNRRRLQRYQGLVRTAVTLDALIDQDTTAPGAVAAGHPSQTGISQL